MTAQHLVLSPPAPVYPQPYALSYFPAYAVDEGPVRAFFRSLLQPLQLTPVVAPPVVATPVVATPVTTAGTAGLPWSSGYAAPAASPATVYRPALTTFAPAGTVPSSSYPAHILSAPAPGSYAPQSPGVGFGTASPSPIVMSPAAVGRPLGTASEPPADGPVYQMLLEQREERRTTSGPAPQAPLQRYHLQYHPERDTLPSTSSVGIPPSIYPVTQRREPDVAGSDVRSARRAARATSEQPDASGWRAVP